MKRAEKVELVEMLHTEWQEVESAYLLGFRGLSVPAVTKLRRNIREANGRCRVVKNTLARRALESTPVEGLLERMDGPTAIAFTKGDPVELVKILVDFAKDHPALVVQGGVLEREWIDAKTAAQVAKMPGKTDLDAHLVFLLSSPVRRLATALAAPVAGLVNVLSQVGEKNEEAHG